MRPSAAADVVATVKKAGSGKWKTDENGRRYRLDKNGNYIKDAWRKIKGSVFHFDEQGYVETGWIKYQGKTYCADANGKLYIDKWVKKGKKYYYLRANGVLARDRVVKSGQRFCYVDESGARVTNTWIQRNGQKYYFDRDGFLVQNNWVLYDGNFYYLGASGALVVGHWIRIKDAMYYVGKDGAMKRDCVVNGYYLDSSGKRTIKVFTGNYIFVGDSRTEGMRLSVGSAEAMYIAKVSMGYSWLKETAGVQLRQNLQANPNVTVVLAFGINDLANISNYISYYKSLFADFPETRFYVMAVNPINEALAASRGYAVRTVNNNNIKAFNKKMRAAVGKTRFLDTYTYLTKKGFVTTDGIHYAASEYRNIYSYVVKKIKK